VLFKMLNRGVFSQIHGVVSTGKEANVYAATAPDGSDRAIKVYKTSILVFKDRDRWACSGWALSSSSGNCHGTPQVPHPGSSMPSCRRRAAGWCGCFLYSTLLLALIDAGWHSGCLHQVASSILHNHLLLPLTPPINRYVSGDFRFRTGYCRSNPRKMVAMWAEKEMRNLVRLRAAGVRAPEPLLLRTHVLVMEFIGTNGVAAPRLRVRRHGLAPARERGGGGMSASSKLPGEPAIAWGP
jgi:hypothetical protein